MIWQPIVARQCFLGVGYMDLLYLGGKVRLQRKVSSGVLSFSVTMVDNFFCYVVSAPIKHTLKGIVPNLHDSFFSVEHKR